MAYRYRVLDLANGKDIIFLALHIGYKEVLRTISLLY